MSFGSANAFRLVLGASVLAVACGTSSGDDTKTTGSGGEMPASGRGGASSGGAGMAGSAGGGQATGGVGSSGGTAGASAGAGPSAPRAACSAPVVYRNLFSEVLGKSQAEIDEKLATAVAQLFHGTDDQPIYYEMGADEAYVTDIANDDVRSEGQSYGMFIAVQMDMKSEFDKLWKFAATRMRQSTGLFAWQLTTSGSVKSAFAAPDGEEYFAMALLLASRRWGDGTGTDYAGEAKKVMSAMLSAGDFNKNPAIVTFGPGNNYSDASYVLPLFYSEWACFDSANAAFWQSATTYARTFFQKATHATTGLAPERSGFDGSPQGDFGPDAWRVPMNIMLDLNLNAADPWQTTYAARMAAFWNEKGLSDYGSGYTLAGTETTSGHGTGLIAMNAMLAFGLPAADGAPFLKALWDRKVPTGMYRYYDGCLYLLSLLHLSGKTSLFY